MPSDPRSYLDFFKVTRKGIKAKTAAWYLALQQERQRGKLPFGRVQSADGSTRDSKGVLPFIMLGSNDYLGLSRHPKVLAAMHDAINDFGCGTSGSPLLSGRYELTKELEEKLAALHGMEDAVAFSSTYAANVGSLSGLLEEGDTALLDMMSHTSIQDGTRMAGCEKLVFRHNDLEHLSECLQQVDPSRTLVFVDSVYSMEGSFCPLRELVATIKPKGAILAIDEAHALGVVGVRGEGLAAHLKMSGDIDIVTGSLGKSLGSHGGYAAGTKEMCEYLRFNAHSYMFSSGLPPVNAAAALASLAIMEEEDICARMQDNIHFIRSKLAELGFPVPQDPTGITPILVGDETKTTRVAAQLEEQGIFVNAAIFPAVPVGRGILRLSASATHKKAALEVALQKVADLVLG